MAELKELFEQFFNAGKLMFESGNFTVAAENFTKAIFVALDSIIERKLGIPPSNHEKRKEIVEMGFKDYLPILKKAYRIHRLTYRSLIDRGTAEVLMRYAEKLGKDAGFIEKTP